MMSEQEQEHEHEHESMRATRSLRSRVMLGGLRYTAWDGGLTIGLPRLEEGTCCLLQQGWSSIRRREEQVA